MTNRETGVTTRLGDKGRRPSDDVVRKMLGENYLRVFAQVWKSKQ